MRCMHMSTRTALGFLMLQDFFWLWHAMIRNIVLEETQMYGAAVNLQEHFLQLEGRVFSIMLKKPPYR